MGQTLPKPVMSIVMEQDAAARAVGVEDDEKGCGRIVLSLLSNAIEMQT